MSFLDVGKRLVELLAFVGEICNDALEVVFGLQFFSKCTPQLSNLFLPFSGEACQILVSLCEVSLRL